MYTTPSLKTEKVAEPWYAHRWPWLLMLGPVIVILAGIHTTWLAFTKQDALVVGDYYKQGKAINQDLKRDRVASGLGLKVTLRHDAAAGRLSGTILSHGQPYAGKLSIKLVHSTLPEKDMTLETEADGGGNFSVSLPMLEIARWQVVVENGPRDWRLNGTWAWPQERAIALRAETFAEKN